MKLIPHLITCLNLWAGCIALVQILKFEDYKRACLFVFLACIFDFLDGLVARLLQSSSDLGKELDTLSDIVSFGVVPSCMVYSFLSSGHLPSFISYCAFLLAVFSAFRLTRFNLDTRQKANFIGLPVPACCLFWSGFIPILPRPSGILIVLILALIVIFCFLMVSDCPMFSLKFKNFRWQDNQYPFFVLFLACLFVGIFSIFNMPYFGISLTIVAYIVLALVKNYKRL